MLPVPRDVPQRYKNFDRLPAELQQINSLQLLRRLPYFFELICAPDLTILRAAYSDCAPILLTNIGFIL